MNHSFILAGRWADVSQAADIEATPLRYVTGGDGREQVFLIRAIFWPGDVRDAMDRALCCNNYKGHNPLLRDDEILCNTIPVPS